MPVSKPYDVATKHLVEGHPAEWLALAGIVPAGPLEVIDADLAAVTAEADKVIRIGGDRPELVNIELQAGYDARFDIRALRYNVLLDVRHELPVRTVVILLCPDADGPAMNGRLVRKTRGGETYIDFRYRVVRVWELSVEDVLAGGLGTLPLAPLADVADDRVPAVIERMRERVDREAGPGEAPTFWAATYLLMGMRFGAEMVDQLLKGVQAMRESTTYQAILEEGKAAGKAEGRVEGKASEAKAILIRQGRRKFGGLPAAVSGRIEDINDLSRLEALCDRIITAASWDELLAGE